ncbi:DUF3999 domain-containing protein [Lysobacter sp. S4-A87]|uniref:DUF3999 domain-containing protein n=1 Tax=Lysobacter sp. S4-A87 TaxID=2925843 RepID=UPI001F533728|nr:DUF3999 domain-containing protein [Lysobacter sp. S4-A87]UNK50885.1 DUF3999 domain-containing protein [Lysobacter sp. S4-A87]
MKRLARIVCLQVACLLLAAPAVASEDFAQQWPLKLSRDDGGAYRVTLDASVYRQLYTHDLRDFEVRNHDGATVPSALFAPEQPLVQAPARIALPWFRLPATPAGGPAGGWELTGTIDGEGRLRGVQARVNGAAADALPQNVLLVDASQAREAITALELQWQPASTPASAPASALDLGFRVEGSDDLDQWQPLPVRGRLVDLQRDGRRLLQRRIELSPARHVRYLRLTPDRSDQPIEITAVSAELAGSAVASAPQWQPLRGRRIDQAGRDAFEFNLEGRFPVQQVDVELPGNHAVEWRLESRDDSGAPWQLRAGPWMAWQVDSAGRASRSGARVLDRVVRDRYWRLSASTPVSGDPALRLGYRPEVVVFLAQGPAPYSLVAGSARARRADSPLSQLVDAMREQRGDAWQPAPASLGAAQALAGDAAFTARRDWTSWLLWSVLVLGALVVSAFALSLLRQPRPAAGQGAAHDPETPGGA